MNALFNASLSSFTAQLDLKKENLSMKFVCGLNSLTAYAVRFVITVQTKHEKKRREWKKKTKLVFWHGSEGLRTAYTVSENKEKDMESKERAGANSNNDR